MARQKRNELCACGSGKKYKACHGGQRQRPGEEPESRSDKLVFGFTAVAVVALVIWGLVTMFSSSPAPEPGTTTGAPSGTAPAGKVWSEEHQHYH